ncbi:MAG: hypothetical protein ACPG7F_05365 [Aggregatilineales bacterium]
MTKDTIIVAAKEETFEDTFLAQNCWYAISINEKQIPDIRYIAAYRSAPVSAVTHFAKIASIEPYEGDKDKYILHFEGSAKRLACRIQQGKTSTHIQSKKYTSLENMLAAKTLDDL